jgi:hypothetical protein
MKYRKLDTDGDYTFGLGDSDFYSDTPEAVAQAVLTRLKLDQGEWFLDINEGTPYSTEILGTGTIGRYDFAIKDRIINTFGVQQIREYYSYIDPNDRSSHIFCVIDTIYGQTNLQATL